MSDIQTGTIETDIPARLDRLPWARFHWLVVIGLGTVWILDGLEVTIVGSIAARLTEDDSGIAITTSQIGTAAAVYIAGAALGALFFGQLTDRFGRKKLFLITLGVYIVATGATAFAHTALFFFIARFFAGAGIGGEYAAINSAIDELIPARVRGRVDLMINGSYWLGAAAGAGLALVLLDKDIFAADVGWRVTFGLGVVLGAAVLLVRRHVPESPRWLFIHGQEEEAERIVGGIERDIEEEEGTELEEPESTIKVRQVDKIPFRTIASTAFKLYPKRAILGFSLFVGQAFLYNGVTFNLGGIFSNFYGISSGTVPIFIVIFALANFLGPVTLGRLFDTVGRKPMIAGTYLGSAVVAVVLGVLFASGALGTWGFEAFIVLTFFLASAGASAAYLTVSEIFPMETRALAIAFFYAIGTAVGGITGPLLFANLIDSGDRGQVALAFYIGAAVMAAGGIVELLFGVKAEGATLEDIAKPLTVEDAEDDDAADEDGVPGEAQTDKEDGEDDGRAKERRESARRNHERRGRRQARLSGRRGRYRPGPGAASSSPGMGLIRTRSADGDLDREVAAITEALREQGPLERRALAEAVGARHWGPGRFRSALDEAVEDGEAQRTGGSRYELTERSTT